MAEFIVSVDIGRKRDFYAELILQDVPRFVDSRVSGPDRVIRDFHVVHLKRMLGASFQDMTESCLRLLGHRELVHNSELVVDGTGVGQPVVEELRRRGARPFVIVVTGGGNTRLVPRANLRQSVSGDPRFELQPMQVIEQVNIPKIDLVGAGTILIEQGRVVVAQDLPEIEREAFKEQLLGFRGKLNERTGRTAYEAETEELHDDYVSAFLMAAWFAMNRHMVPVDEHEIIQRDDKHLDWDPMEQMTKDLERGVDPFGDHGSGVDPYPGYGGGGVDPF